MPFRFPWKAFLKTLEGAKYTSGSRKFLKYQKDWRDPRFYEDARYAFLFY